MDRASGVRFWSEFERWASTVKVVSSFARLSLFAEELIPFDGRVRVAQPNVVRELQLPDDVLWGDFEHKVRKNVNRARGEGVVIEHDPSCARIDAFGEIYAHTMTRREVPSRLRFTTSALARMVDELGGAIQLFFARVNTHIVAAELVGRSAHHGYSLLGGTLASAFSLRPNDLLKYEIFRRLRDEGLTHYVLGGGPKPRDGVFRYKRSFAPAGIVDFKVGERVYDQEAYEALVWRRATSAAADGVEWNPDPDFFPAYRSA
jgi:lipid II:glycine glycyltransferase (peptidoglycan interpeptide bridge formation enzyme)